MIRDLVHRYVKQG